MGVGFIGLGNMGRAQAERLLSQGVDLVVWNRSAERAQGITAESAETPAQVMASCDIVFTCLFDSSAVRQVAEGPDGLFAAPRREARVVVDCTTNAYSEAVAFHTLFAEHGIAYLEAPVLGSVVPASRGELVMLVSGEEPPLVKAEPYLHMLASEVVYMPPAGSATAMKLVANDVLGSVMAVVAEATALGEKAGIPPERVLDVLAFGPAAPQVAAKRDKLLSRDFTPHFSADVIRKDLRNTRELAANLEARVPMSETAQALYDEAARAGRGAEDFAVVYEVLGGGEDPYEHEDSEAEPT